MDITLIKTIILATASNDIPDWFEYQSEIEQPIFKLPYYYDPNANYTEQQRKDMESYFFHDIVATDADDVVLNWIKELDEYNKKCDLYRNQIREERFFKWKEYYLKKLLSITI